MIDKWTKEQIETAKAILKNRGCVRLHDSCQDSGCSFSDGDCPFIINGQGPDAEYYDERYRELVKCRIKNHKHDADDVIECKLYMTGPTKEEIAKAEKLAMSVNNTDRHDYWRYQFACMAMQGLLSNSAIEEWSQNVFDKRCKEAGLSDKETGEKWVEITAESAVYCADELIKKLEEKK